MTSPLPTLSHSQERHLLTSILSGSSSLPDLAASLNISLLDLLELIASPEIQSRLVAAEQAAAHAFRARATQHLDTVLDTLTEVLDSHRRDFEALKSRTDPEAIHLRRAERPHIRRAATTVLRLTRFSPLAPNAILTARPAPPPRAGAPSEDGASPRGGALRAPRNPPAQRSSALANAPSVSNTQSPLPQPQTLNISSRAQPESASATPGSRRPFPSHAERALRPEAASPARRTAPAPIASLLSCAGALTPIAHGPAP